MATRTDYEILVVEDTPAMAQLTILTLQRSGFHATHVIDGESAMHYMESRQPQLVLLDLNLPGISGWQVMDYIAGRFGADQVKVIVTTAYGDTANRVVGKLQSVYKYIVKPYSPADLIDNVERALGIKE